MVMNVASMFRDIIETPEQRQQRQMLERLNQAQSFMAPRGSVASLLNPLAGATFMNIAESQDRVKENLGGMLGLDMRDTGQKVQDILSKGNTSTPKGLTDLAIALQNVAPAQAIQLRQEAAAQTAAQSAAAAEAELRRLQKENEIAEKAGRLAQESAEREEKARKEREKEFLRTGLRAMVRKELMKYGPSDQLDNYINRINGGQYDTVEGTKLLIQEINPKDDIINLGGGIAYNNTTGKHLIPPETDPVSGLVKDLNPDKFDLASIGRYEFEVNQIAADKSLSDVEKREKLRDATNIPLQRVEGEKWELITWDKETGDRYISVPDSSDKIGEKEKNLREFNSRNNIAASQAQVGIDRIGVIRKQFQEASQNDESVTGSLFDIIQSKVAGTSEYRIKAETLTVTGVLGLTALNQARAGSAVGASGFGALSAPELELLQTSIANLDMGLPEEQFLANLNYIENTLKALKGKTGIELTYNQYVGLEPKPVYEGDL